MRGVERSQILDHVTYSEERAAFRASAMAAKARRRVHVGESLTLLFENHESVRYQIHEMLLAERIVREADIDHEIETYNELLGGPGEIGATLLIEIPDPAVRDERLREWLGLEERIYLELADGRRSYATFDPRQVGEDRLSSVQFLKFDTAGETPVAVGVDHDRLTERAELSPDQRAALAEDLATS